MKQITLNKVGYAYDTEWILEDLNLTIQQGDGCILLTGKNGAGKSTLLNVVCGFLPPDYGNLSRGGMTIGYLPYEHPLYRHLTVLENLRYFLPLLSWQKSGCAGRSCTGGSAGTVD